jgi:hypothetical protein
MINESNAPESKTEIEPQIETLDPAELEGTELENVSGGTPLPTDACRHF